MIQSRFVIITIIILLSCSGVSAKDIYLPRKVKRVESVMTEPNVHYIVKYKINLKGKTLSIPEGSELVFEKGCFKNGTIEGNVTILDGYNSNIFTNCLLTGTWQCKTSNSKMFNDNLDAASLLSNLSVLSNKVILYADREYVIERDDLTLSCESITSIGDKRAVIRIRTTNPNKNGLLFSAGSVEISNLIIKEDFENKLGQYSDNDHRNGCTVATAAPRGWLQKVLIHDCVFEWGTPSSYFASSTTRDCLVENCTFNGYMADHAVYCSRNIEHFEIRNCLLQDVSYTTGLFKVRTSKALKEFKIDSLTVRNLNGYLAVVELMPSNAEIIISNVEVSKDIDKNYKCYGVCIVKDTRESNRADTIDAKSIVFENCHFDYGYPGHPLIARGAGVKVTAETIIYRNVKAKDLSLTGGISKRQVVIE